jgi:hypothetical protein
VPLKNTRLIVFCNYDRDADLLKTGPILIRNAAVRYDRRNLLDYHYLVKADLAELG